MRLPDEVRDQLAVKFQVLFPHLDEWQRRLMMGAEARLLGHGGIRAVARATQVSEATVRNGVDEDPTFGIERRPRRRTRPRRSPSPSSPPSGARTTSRCGTGRYWLGVVQQFCAALRGCWEAWSALDRFHGELRIGSRHTGKVGELGHV